MLLENLEKNTSVHSLTLNLWRMVNLSSVMNGIKRLLLLKKTLLKLGLGGFLNGEDIFTELYRGMNQKNRLDFYYVFGKWGVDNDDTGMNIIKIRKNPKRKF